MASIASGRETAQPSAVHGVGRERHQPAVGQDRRPPRAMPSVVAGSSVRHARSIRTTRSIPARSGRLLTRTGIGSASAASRTASTWPCPISSSATPPRRQLERQLRRAAGAAGPGRRRRRPARARLEAQAAGARRHLVAGNVGQVRHQQVRLLRRGQHGGRSSRSPRPRLTSPADPVGRQVLRRRAPAPPARCRWPPAAAGPVPGRSGTAAPGRPPPRRCPCRPPRRRSARRRAPAAPRSRRWRPRPAAPSPGAGSAPARSVAIRSDSHSLKPRM